MRKSGPAAIALFWPRNAPQVELVMQANGSVALGALFDRAVQVAVERKERAMRAALLAESNSKSIKTARCSKASARAQRADSLQTASGRAL